MKCRMCGENRPDHNGGMCKFCSDLKMMVESNMDLVKTILINQGFMVVWNSKKEKEKNDRVLNM